MRKFIPGIAVLSACLIFTGSFTYAGNNVEAGTTKVKSTLAGYSKNRKAESVTGKNTPALLENASVSSSAMGFWEYDGNTAYMCWLFNKDSEQEIVNYINNIELESPVNGIDAEKLTGNMYAITIWDKDGNDISFTWRDGYVFLKDGNIYKADIDFNRIKDYQWEEKNQTKITSFPCMYYIAKKDGKWNKNFLEKSKKLKANGLKITSVKLNGTGLNIKLKNTKKTQALFGEYFSLQVKIDGKWYYIPAKEEMAFNDIAHILEAGKSIKKTYNISPYGELPAGKYRIVIEGASATFNIN